MKASRIEPGDELEIGVVAEVTSVGRQDYLVVTEDGERWTSHADDDFPEVETPEGGDEPAQDDSAAEKEGSVDTYINDRGGGWYDLIVDGEVVATERGEEKAKARFEEITGGDE